MKQKGSTSSRLEPMGQLIVAFSIFACVYQLTMYAAGSPEAFNYLERSETTNLFPDLRIWTHNAAGCNIQPWELKGSNQCSDGPPFNYPWFPIALFRLLALNETHNTILGYLLGIATIATCFAYKVWKKKHAPQKAKIWIDVSFGAFILSRPMLYALERGQPDLLVLIGIVAICWVCEQETSANNQTLTKSLPIAIAILSALTLTKLYPIVGLFGCLLCSLAALERAERRKAAEMRFYVLLRYSFLLAGLGAACLGPYLLTREFNIHGLGNHGFGLQVQAGAHVSNQLLFKAIIYVLSCLGASLLINQNNWKGNVKPKGLKEINFNLSALAITSTIVTGLYLFTENIYYKLIVLYPVFLWSANSLADTGRTHRRDFGLIIFFGILTIFFIQAMPYDSALQADKENILHLIVYPSVFGGLASFPVSMAVRQVQILLRSAFSLKSTIDPF